jgi:hypothetical protein
VLLRFRDVVLLELECRHQIARLDLPFGIDEWNAADTQVSPLTDDLHVVSFVAQALEVRTTIDQFL